MEKLKPLLSLAEHAENTERRDLSDSLIPLEAGQVSGISQNPPSALGGVFIILVIPSLSNGVTAAGPLMNKNL